MENSETNGNGNGRDGKGRFASGNQLGVGGGRPRRSAEEQYLQTLVALVKKEDWQDIIEKAKEQAKSGDDKARRWLSDYLMGKPVERVEMTGAEGEPIRIVIDK